MFKVWPMPGTPDSDRRSDTDRRGRPTGPWCAWGLGGRRRRQRRDAEHRRPYFVDRFSSFLFVCVLALLLGTIADGVLTLQLLDIDCQEMNPVMAYLLGHGVVSFLLGKYLLTVLGLPLLLVCKNHYLFGTPFRVGYLIPIFAVLYALLLGYQAYMLGMLGGAI
jgi:hypothetical protein